MISRPLPLGLLGGPSLQPYQRRVIEDFWRFYETAEAGPGTRSRFGRIVLPPRTGKTVIAAQIVKAIGMRALFVVPTRALVEQTVREVATWTGVSPGAWFGERKNLGDGINVTTYALLQSEWSSGRPWPSAVSAAEIVFLDEGHHAMTPERLAFVEPGFSPDALRIALTATPDYDERRTLCRFFPSLIHEMTLEEALGLDLLASLRPAARGEAAGGQRRRVPPG